jgi:hypothetical protein
VDASQDFTLTLEVSADPSPASASAPASVQIVSGSVGAVDDVLPPDYTLDTSGLTLLQDVNSGIVTGVSGSINLDFNTQAGDLYLTYPQQDWSSFTFAQLDSQFNIGAAIGIPSGNGNVSIPASALVNVGDQLAETSSIVIWHADNASDVIVYQVIAISFDPPGG